MALGAIVAEATLVAFAHQTTSPELPACFAHMNNRA